MVTEAIPTGLRSRVPAKMTSSMRLPRRLFADCSPRTQLIASLRFDLPHPFGPTMAAMPAPWKRISERSQKDLNPWSSTRLSLSNGCSPFRPTRFARAVQEEAHVSGDADHTKLKTDGMQEPRP